MPPRVALRKESVDRNTTTYAKKNPHMSSLSARRAWIEIYKIIATGYFDYVALRKESVDRNTFWYDENGVDAESLSARRAWIEISRMPKTRLCVPTVALRKESVDRNTLLFVSALTLRPSLSARRAWIEISKLMINPRPHRRRSPQGERG